MKKIIIEWKEKATNDSGKQSETMICSSHPGCCKQGGGCQKKHG